MMFSDHEIESGATRGTKVNRILRQPRNHALEMGCERRVNLVPQLKSLSFLTFTLHGVLENFGVWRNEAVKNGQKLVGLYDQASD